MEATGDDVQPPAPTEPEHFDNLTLRQFIRSYLFRLTGLYVYTASVLITTLAILSVPVWKGLAAAGALTFATLGKRLSRSVIIHGHISRRDLDIAMAESADDIDANYAIGQQFSYYPLQDQPK